MRNLEIPTNAVVEPQELHTYRYKVCIRLSYSGNHAVNMPVATYLILVLPHLKLQFNFHFRVLALQNLGTKTS